jgi:hypothetical protein
MTSARSLDEVGEKSFVKRLFLTFALIGAGTLAACDEPEPVREAPAVVVEEAAEAPAAEDTAVPATDPAALPSAPPVDTLPPEQRSSEESVQPESETLFY